MGMPYPTNKSVVAAASLGLAVGGPLDSVHLTPGAFAHVLANANANTSCRPEALLGRVNWMGETEGSSLCGDDVSVRRGVESMAVHASDRRRTCELQVGEIGEALPE